MNSRIKHFRWTGSVFILFFLVWADCLKAQIDTCPESNILIINIAQDPSVFIIGGGGTICANGTVSMTSTLTGGVGSASYFWQTSSDSLVWNNLSGGQSSAYSTVPLSNTTFFRLLAVFGSSGCDTAFAVPVKINVVPDPMVSIVGGGTICTGGSLTLLSSVSGGTGTCAISWQQSLDLSAWSNIPGQNANFYTTPALSATTHYRAVWACNGTDCNTAYSNVETVTVVGDPTISIAGARESCADETLELNVSANGGVGGLSYQWQESLDGVLFSNVPGATSSFFTTPILTQTIFYKIIIAGAGEGCVSEDTAQLIVHPLPSVTAGNGSNPYCENETISLSAAASGGLSPYLYAWRGNNNFISSIANPTIPMARPSSSGNYIVAITDLNGCGASDTIMVQVNPNPTAVASNTGPYCVNDPISLQGIGGGSYQWAGPNGYSAAVQNPAIPNATSAMAGVYSLSITDANFCADDAQTTVFISNCTEICNNGFDDDGDGLIDCMDLDCAVAPFEITASGPTEFCDGGNVVLTAVGGTNFVWSNGATTASITVDQSSVYFVTVSNTGSCSLVRSIRVTVNAGPVVEVSNSAASISCEHGEVTLMAAGGSRYDWAGPNGFVAHADTFTLNNLTPSASGVYTVTVTNAFGCSGVGTTNFNVNSLQPDIFANGGAITCSSNTVTLQPNQNVPNADYAWTGPNGFTSTEFAPVVSEAGIYELTVRDIPTGCFVQDTALVEVMETTFALSCSGSQKLTCDKDSVMLSAIVDAKQIHYTWTGPNGFFVHNKEPFAHEEGTYTLTAINLTTGCQETCAINVTTDRNPPSATVAGGELTCSRNAVELICIVLQPGMTYYWTGPGGFVSNLQNPIVVQEGLYQVVITNPENGCKSAQYDVYVIDNSN